MKSYISTLALSLLLLGSAKANHLNSDLTVRLHNFQAIIVEFDQISYNNPTTKFTISDLQPGQHHLIVWAIPSSNYYYHDNSPRLMFNGYVDIVPASIINTMITKNHSLRVLRILEKCEQPVVYSPYDPYYMPCPAPLPVPMEMSCANFESLKASIASKSFESTRLLISKQVISNNLVSSRQVGELMDLMTFESSKLDLAKFAYRYTIDQQNYYLTFNQFTFESSIQDLSQFINHS